MHNLTKFDIKEENSITVGKHVSGQHSSHNSNLPLVRSWSANVEPTRELQLLKHNLSVGPMLGQVSTSTTTCCQQLQPLPNVGTTIASYLGYTFPFHSTASEFLNWRFPAQIFVVSERVPYRKKSSLIIFPPFLNLHASTWLF